MFLFAIKRGNSHINYCVSFNRRLRLIASREKRMPKLIKGNVVTLTDDMDDQFGPVNSYEQLNRTLKKMFIEPDEIQSEKEMNAEDDYSTVFENAHQFLDIHKMEEKDHKRMVKKHIIKKKYFKDPQDTNLLTHAAKTQIRYLHQLNPMEWTPERLAESFPASVSGIKKLLKNNGAWANSEEKIKAHDAEVAKRWECLKSNSNLSSFSPVTVKLWREGKLIQDFYSGNVNLPQPSSPKEEIIEKPKKIGEYASMVKNYLDSKKKNEEKSLKKLSPLRNMKSDMIVENNFFQTKSEKVMQHLHIKYPTRAEVEDKDSASYIAVHNVDGELEPDMLPDQFEKNITEEFSEMKHKSATDQAYYEWLEEKKLAKSTKTNEVKPYDPANYVSKVKKFDSDTIELSKSRSSNSSAVYLYDSTTGYQHPFGKDVVQEKIRIPQHLRKKGAVYKVGLSFYDDRGEFLYKIPM